MRKNAHKPLDLSEPQFSQPELCAAAEITMPTSNNWIQSGALRPADVGSRRTRKPRLFSLLTIYEAKVTGELVKRFDESPTTAAAMARRTTAGHTWPWSVQSDLASNKNRDFWAIVFWSDECNDWDVWVDIASNNVLRIEMEKIARARSEPRLAERPILLLPVSRYLASVLKSCQAMVVASSKPGDAWHACSRRRQLDKATKGKDG
jgi:hypothetical protein